MTVSQQIIEALDALCQKFGIAINWTSDNILPYVEDLAKNAVRYELYTSLLYSIIFAIGMAILIVFIRLIWCWLKKDEPADDESIGIAGTFFVIFLICSITCFVLLLSQLVDIITCFIFPEKVVYDIISNMIR